MVEPSSEVELSRTLVYSTALRTRFRGITLRDGVLVRGEAGWGEFSPFWDYDDAESSSWLRATLESAHQGWPAPIRSHIPVNVTVPAVSGERAREIVLNSGGCTTAKVKVAEPGQSVAQEIERLEAVREALGPDGAIRIDANAAWDLDEALRRLPLLDRAAGGLEYAEQPCASVEDLAALRRRQSVPIAADESFRRAADPLAVKRAEAADVVVLKVQPLGGVRACLELAEAVGLPVVVSSALESSFGIAAGLVLYALRDTIVFFYTPSEVAEKGVGKYKVTQLLLMRKKFSSQLRHGSSAASACWRASSASSSSSSYDPLPL